MVGNKDTLSNGQGTQLAQTGSFAPKTDLAAFQKEMGTELAGLEFRPDRIKMGPGGSTQFEVPGEDESEFAKSITAVIVHQHPAYAYYKDKYTGGSNPPDCGSFNGIKGTGTPGGLCKTCPYNQFGSGEGKSKACKNRVMIYLLREGDIFPSVLSLPTGSRASFTNYIKHLIMKGRRMSRVVTEITLKKATNASGIAYSQAVFRFVRELTPEEKEAVSRMTDMVKEYAAGLTMSDMVDAPAEENVPFVDTETGEVIEPLK